MTTLLAFVLFPLDSPPALYAALFGVLILSGVGLPIPEEATLIIGGYLAYLEFIDFWSALYVLIAGIVAADVGGYLLGRFGGEYIAGAIARWRPLKALHEKVRALFARHGDKIVVMSRPLFVVRVAVPMYAGHTKMRFVKFLLLDIAAAVPWTLFLVSLSYYLGSGFDLLTEIKEIKHVFFIVLGLGIVLFGAVRFVKSGRNAGMV